MSIYNPTYYRSEDLSSYGNNKQLYDTRNKIYSFKHYTLKDGFKVGMFQGNRGDNPELDFIVKFLMPGPKGRLRTPKHVHWVVDFLLKAEHYPNQVKEIIKFYRRFYDKAKPFQTVIERNNYQLVTVDYICEKYPGLRHKGTYSLEFDCTFIELFTLCEKQSPRENKMFSSLLDTFVAYGEGKKDYFQVLNATAAGF